MKLASGQTTMVELHVELTRLVRHAFERQNGRANQVIGANRVRWITHRMDIRGDIAIPADDAKVLLREEPLVDDLRLQHNHLVHPVRVERLVDGARLA